MPPIPGRHFLSGEAFLDSMIGCLVPPPPWTGTVTGIFSKAVAVLHPDGALISIVPRREWLEARAMMPSDGWSGFIRTLHHVDDSGIKPEVDWDGSTLTITGQTGGSGPDTRLIFSASAVWDPRIRKPASIHVDHHNLATTVAIIETGIAIARTGGRLAEGIHGEGIFRTAFERLRLADGFPATIVGFGPGTTPAGDDWLAGFLSARDLIAGGYGRAEKDLRSSLIPCLGRTTPAGRTLLLGAIAGVPPAYLNAIVIATETCLAAVSQGVSKPSMAAPAMMLADAVDVALEHGATSGEDALAGFTEGLKKAGCLE